MTQEYFRTHARVFDDPTKKDRRDVPPTMHRHRCTTPIGMPELLVRTSLPDFLEPHRVEDLDDLPRAQDRDLAHTLRSDGLDPHEFRLKPWLSVLQEHRDHLTKIAVQLVERCPLRMSTRESGHIAYEQTGIHVSFDDRRIRPHLVSLSRRASTPRFNNPPTPS